MVNQGKVKSIKGSILMPHNAGLRFILNFASMNGNADGELQDIFAKKWSKVRSDVKSWYASKDGKYKLGAISDTAIQSDAWMIHLLVEDNDGVVQDGAVEAALKQTAGKALYEHATIHVSELLVKKCPNLKKLIQEQLVSKGLSVCYYDES